jgi:hypothetical protein
MGTAYLLKPAPVGAPFSLEERSGVEVREGSYQGEAIWKTTVLNRPVAAFAGPDVIAGGETAQARAHWAAAVLMEAHFEGRPLKFAFREELEESSEVWLVGHDQPDKFLMRVTPAERDLFDTPAPALARRWSQLMKDTFTLLGAPGSPGESTGTLLLLPWKNRAATLSGGRQPSGVARVELLKEAFGSLKPDQQEDILSSYIPNKDSDS